MQDLGLGKFCCPRGKGEAEVCCNTDPNPPPPTRAPITDGGKGAATSIPATAFTSSLISTLFFFWLMWGMNTKIEAHIYKMQLCISWLLDILFRMQNKQIILSIRFCELHWAKCDIKLKQLALEFPNWLTLENVNNNDSVRVNV